MARFAALGLADPLLRVLKNRGYKAPTPIQAKAIPSALRGRDIVGIAQTGTGKTAAFALPMLQNIGRTRPETPPPTRGLVLCPTRELAVQTGKRFAAYGRQLTISSYVLYGGVPVEPQIAALERGVDIVVATPGRLRDLHRRGHVSLDRVAHVVLDEADRLLDQGFLDDIRRIVGALPRERQSMLFSATFPAGVERLAARLVRDPVRIHVGPVAKPVASARQQVLYVKQLDKPALTAHLVDRQPGRCLVFVRTKRGADRLCTLLQRAGVAADALHGDRSQAARSAVVQALREGATRVVVATDVAARGLDIAELDLVVNHDLPADPDTYVHRVGRVGRAGREGLALSLCDETTGGLLRDIERHTGAALTPNFAHPWHSHDAVPHADASGAARSGRRRKRSRRRR